MSHDAIFGIVVERMLVARSSRTDLLTDARDRLDAEWTTTVSVLVRLEGANLAGELRSEIASTRMQLADYVGVGRAVLTGATTDDTSANAAFTDFLRSRDDLELRLRDITTHFETSAAQLRTDAERSRAKMVRLLAVITVAALAVTLLMYTVVHRSIHRSVQQERRRAEDLMFNQNLLSALDMADTEKSVFSVSGAGDGRARRDPH